MYDTILSRSRHLYKWVFDNKVMADGFTSQKKSNRLVKS